MSLSIKNPTPDMLRRWGVFAYCTEDERKAAFNSPHGERKRIEKRLEREVAEYKKKQRKI